MQRSTAQERPWSDHEKVTLLAEMIKISSIPPHALLTLIRDYDIHPRWEDMPFPEGRSMNACKLAFEEMKTQVGFYQPHVPNPYSQQMPQAQIPHTAITRKRQLPGSDIKTSSFPAIQPKPPGLSSAPYTPLSAEATGSFGRSPADSTSEPAKKRRGRPSNVQIEKEKAAAAAEGREWQPRPPRPPRKRKGLISKASPPRAGAGLAHINISQTPEIQMSEAGEQESGGKKERRKAPDRSTVARVTPYDPVRQSTPDTASFAGEGPSSGTQTQHPQQGHSQLAEGTRSIPEHRDRPKSQIPSDSSQQPDTDQ